MKKKVLVTGGTGYIGSITILEMIRNTDFEVVCVDNFMNSSPKTIDRIEKISGVRVKCYELDLRNGSELEKIFEKEQFDGVIHFAALKSVPESLEKSHLYYENNLCSQLNIMKCCEKYQVKNLIFSSSCSVYGEVQNLPVDEDTPLSESKCPYAHTKRVGEEMLAFWAPQSQVQTIALRYFNPVGADHTGMLGELPHNLPTNLVPVITNCAAGIIPQMKVFGDDYPTRDGTCIRDYVHVSDIASAHIMAMQKLLQTPNNKFFEIYNLGTGNGVTIYEMINAFQEVSGVKLNYIVAPRRDGDVGQIYSNCDKVEKALGWKAQYGVKEMMDTAWKWQLYIASEK